VASAFTRNDAAFSVYCYLKLGVKLNKT